VTLWINNRLGARLDARDRGLQYGDGLFETMRVCRGRVRLLKSHLERLQAGCRQLKIAAPPLPALRRELERAAAARREAVMKLIVTRGSGKRGYRPSGRERCTRILALHALPNFAPLPVRVRLCTTRIGINPDLAGLKTLNRLESVLARSEWSDARIWEGLMRDVEENIVCGTMSNLFVRRGSTLMTPLLDRCGVAGVMRRWVLETASDLKLHAVQCRLRWDDLNQAEEVFMSNAVVGIRSVAVLERGRQRLRGLKFDAAIELRERLALL
jgi:4-amino-4-deoxychorismate lyase